MPTKIIVRRKNGFLVPVDQESTDAVMSFQADKDLLCRISGPRNLKQLRMFWALCNIVAENDDTYTTKEAAKQAIMRDLKYVDFFLGKDGTINIVTKSIALESMKQPEFNEFFKGAIDLVAGWLKTQPKEISDRVNEITADRRYDGYMHG